MYCDAMVTVINILVVFLIQCNRFLTVVINGYLSRLLQVTAEQLAFKSCHHLLKLTSSPKHPVLTRQISITHRHQTMCGA